MNSGYVEQVSVLVINKLVSFKNSILSSLSNLPKLDLSRFGFLVHLKYKQEQAGPPMPKDGNFQNMTLQNLVHCKKFPRTFSIDLLLLLHVFRSGITVGDIGVIWI